MIKAVARFGLIMRTGVDGGKLKTKVTCHPPALEEVSKMKNEAPGAEKAKFAANKGRITFTRKFKCLGLLITQEDLKASDNIVRRINQARARVQELINASVDVERHQS